MQIIKTFLSDWFVGLFYYEGQTLFNGFIIGILLTLFFILTFKFISLFIKVKYVKGITLKNTSGKFYLTKEAIKNLIAQSTSSIEAFDIVEIRIYKKKFNFCLDLIINVRVLNSIDSLRYHLEQQVLKILADNFSMHHRIKVNILVKKFVISAKNKEITSVPLLQDDEIVL